MSTHANLAPQANAAPQSGPAPYSPLMFLAALGAGGLVVTFFMYLMFWVPHPGQPVPVFEDIIAAFSGGTLAMQAAISVALAGIAFFGATLVRLLVWNVQRLRQFARTPAYETLMGSNAGSQIMAMPLAFAMAVNAGFILGLVFVPNLWSVVEYLFPLAMIAFAVIGYYAFKLFARFASNALGGGLDCAKNNSLAQMLPAFAFAMIGVGLAAPAAMSTNAVTVAFSLGLSTLFILTSVIQGLIALTLGVRSMMENGLAADGAPTLMIGVPILTVLGIAFLRQNHGLHVHFDLHTSAGSTFMMLTTFFAAQILLLAAGWAALKKTHYLGRFISGPESSPGSLALLCPVVAFSVMGHFLINKGLVATGLIAKFGVAYWSVTAIPLAFQVLAIWLFFKLLAKLIRQAPAAPLSTAATA